VSDPGTALVREATRRGVEVRVIPGPSAVTSAVALSGLVDAPYRFMGFLPRQGGKRALAIADIARSPEPVVLFEAANRTQRTLTDLAHDMPERSAVVCRELTKVHEETVRGSLSELAALERGWRGEVCVVLGSAEIDDAQEDEQLLESRIRQSVADGGSTRDIVAELADLTRLTRRELYQRVERVRHPERAR